jgi:hypothetical protein
MTNKTFGFIILRHVKDDITNTYWLRCYNCIRKYYPDNKILIIDDNSDQAIINKGTDTSNNGNVLHNTQIINSEYPQRGELLPYYYYLTNKLFDIAIILHDSVFVNEYIKIEDILVDKYRFIWDFEHHWDQTEDELRIISLFEDDELTAFYNNKRLWKGCFGSMSIITHDYLTHINSKYDISKLLDCILTRYNRCSFERVIACMLHHQYILLLKETEAATEATAEAATLPPLLTSQTLLTLPPPSLHGDINIYAPRTVRIGDLPKYRHMPLIKVWTGR